LGSPRHLDEPVSLPFQPIFVKQLYQNLDLLSIALVKELMEKTTTTTGLKAFVHIIDKVYETGRKVAADFKETLRIVFDDFLPQWNYRALPMAPAIAQVI